MPGSGSRRPGARGARYLWRCQASAGFGSPCCPDRRPMVGSRWLQLANGHTVDQVRRQSAQRRLLQTRPSRLPVLSLRRLRPCPNVRRFVLHSMAAPRSAWSSDQTRGSQTRCFLLGKHPNARILDPRPPQPATRHATRQIGGSGLGAAAGASPARPLLPPLQPPPPAAACCCCCCRD